VPRVEPLRREELPQFEPLFQMAEGAMGFVPRSLLTMARWPEMMQAFAGLAGTVNLSGKLPPALKQLVAFVSSHTAGCRYCQAHTSHDAERNGLATEKLDAAFEFETSPLFSEAERAALRLARDASFVPNAVEDAHFEALRRHFGDEEIVELVAVIALFGFLNRWNDTMATALEADPLAFAESRLGDRGWTAGKHAADG
jgi:uncharacterized peroxidase-related enzyme